MQTDWISPSALQSLNKGFVVAVTLEAAEGKAEEVAQILRKLAPPTMAEPGVKLFLPYRSPENPAVFYIYELYVDEAGWKAHQDTAHFKSLIAEMLPLLAKRERVPYVPFL